METICLIRKNFIIYLTILLVSFLIVALEVVYLQMMSYVKSSPTEGLVTIPIVLTGMAIGSLSIFYMIKRRIRINILLYILMFSISIIISFLGFAFGLDFNGFLFILPFFFGAMIITYFLVYSQIHLAYFFNLIGSGLGIIFVVVFLPYFGAENLVLIASITSSCFALISAFFSRAQKILVLSLFVLIFALFLLSHNFFTNSLNLIKTYPCDRSSMILTDIFCSPKRDSSFKIYASRSSIISRIDVFQINNTIYFYDNGLQVIYFERFDYNQFTPYLSPQSLPYVLLREPKVLVMGPFSSHLKIAKAFNASLIVGVEINPAMASLLQNEVLMDSDYAYNLAEIKLMDGRSYIKNVNETFDLITFFATFLLAPSQFSPIPYYIFTSEAFTDYFNHLSDNGIIVIESREVAMQQILSSAIDAMRNAGYENPYNHVYALHYNEPGGYPFISKYFVFIKKSEFLENETNVLDKTTMQMPPWKDGTIDFIIHSNDTAKNFPEKASMLTDTIPFFNIKDELEDSTVVYRTLQNFSIFVLITFLIPLLFFFRKFDISLRKSSKYLLIFALLGMGYIVLEISLIEKFYLFLGGPVLSLSVVLGSFLISGGFGSYFSNRIQLGKISWILLLLIVFILVYLVSLEKILTQFVFFNITGKIFISLFFLVPISFLAGIPFPFALNLVKHRLSLGAEYVATMFAIDSLFSVMGSIFALFFVRNMGYFFTFFSTILFYGAILALFFTFIKKSEI